MLESTLAEITRYLSGRGVRPLLLKGPAFARWLYDDPRQRSYGDLDLLVDPQQFEAAMGGLMELGFEPRSSTLRSNERRGFWHAHLVRAGAPGTFPVKVELHHTLALLFESPSVVWRRLTEGAQSIEVAGEPVSVPSAPASALIVALHAAQHAIVYGPWLQPLEDLRRAVERSDLETWRAASQLASALHVGPAFAAGLRLEPSGRAIAERLGLGQRPLRAARDLAVTPAAVGIDRLIATPGASSRLALLASYLVPSRRFMRHSSPLARRGTLGLVGAYVCRPFQLAWRLPSGVRAWRRAGAP